LHLHENFAKDISLDNKHSVKYREDPTVGYSSSVAVLLFDIANVHSPSGSCLQLQSRTGGVIGRCYRGCAISSSHGRLQNFFSEGRGQVQGCEKVDDLFLIVTLKQYKSSL